jgi:hypothetical protein
VTNCKYAVVFLPVVVANFFLFSIELESRNRLILYAFFSTS